MAAYRSRARPRHRADPRALALALLGLLPETILIIALALLAGALYAHLALIGLN